MTDSIFNNGAGSQDGTGDASSDQPSDAWKKRYDDSQAFIEQLKKEKQELLEEFKQADAERKTMKSLQELYEKNKSVVAPSNVEPTSRVEPDSRTVVTKTISTKDVETMVADAMNKYVSNTARNQNVTEVVRELEKAYGKDYSSVVSKKLESLGVSEDFVDDIAGRSPKALYALIGYDPATSTNTIRDPNAGLPPLTRKVTTFENSNSNVRNRAYYDKLRRDDPKEFFKPHTQSQRMKDAKEMGDAFDN